MTQNLPLKIESYFEAWTSGLSLLLSKLEPSQWAVKVENADAENDAALAMRVTAEGGLTGRQWLLFSSADVRAFVNLSLSDRSESFGLDPEAQAGTLASLCRQWCSFVASGLMPIFGEVSFQLQVEPGPTSDFSVKRVLRAVTRNQSVTAMLAFDREIFSALDRRTNRAQSTLPTAQPESAASLAETNNLAILMDLELDVRLRFGSCHMPLREVLEMAPGVVLELDREIQEPVDLLLNDKVIARGEVVVIDGNYGFRVAEMVPDLLGAECLRTA